MPARIMVINDNQEILDSFRYLLEEEGYVVVLAAFAPREIEEVERVQPDLIVLDLVFGQEKLGWQLLQKLKMHRSTATIPVIICTAATRDVRDIEGYLRAHQVGVVGKPFDIDDFLGAVAQGLSKAMQNGLDGVAKDAQPVEAPDTHTPDTPKRRKSPARKSDPPADA